MSADALRKEVESVVTTPDRGFPPVPVAHDPAACRRHLCEGCQDHRQCAAVVCKLGRTKRRPAPPPLPEVHDFGSIAGLVAELRAHAARIAHHASMAMTEGLDDPSLVRDMHDINGSVGNIHSVAELLERRFGDLRWSR